MDGWMVSFTLTPREAICSLPQLYINVRTCDLVSLLKRTWSLVGACRGLVAVVFGLLPSWRAALKPL